MLKELRQKEAKKKGLPPFVIFLENSLLDMATLYPTTLEELEKCQGVSKGKAIRYGKPFVEMVAKYVEENEIEKPDEFVMKSVVNKSGNKVFLIQNIDKRIPLETIAKNKGWRMDEMLDINYCIRKEVEYYAKARIAADQKLKEAYEATAREFAFRARQLRLKNEGQQ